MFNTRIFETSPTLNAIDGNHGTSQGPPQPQPIDINMGLRALIFQAPARVRRELLAHSQGMGGVLWGLVTIGLWLKDEVMMTQATLLHQHYRRDLFRHHNHQMLMLPPTMALYLPGLELEYCKDYLCCGELLPTLHDLLRHYEEAHILPLPPQEQPHPMLDPLRHARNNLNIMHNIMETVSTTDVFLNNNHQSNYHFGGNMKSQSQPGNSSLVAPTQFAPQFQQQVQQQQQQQLPAQSLSQSRQSRLQGRQGTPMDDDDNTMYIDDPARHLYVMENDEHKPFKCPVIGCEKTYKNQNGLKYHRLHGHQGQTLKENPDGTISIIDPESNTPYLDGAGMEKDKPYRCEVCGKRYKNLNGLKYHRGHTTH